MRKSLIVAVFAGALLMSSQQASQAAPLDLSGFVCHVGWISPEQNSAGGKFGFLSGGLHSEPFCQGSFIGFFSLFSRGQTFDPRNHAFTERQLLDMFQTLQAQARAGQRVNMFSLDTPAGDFRGVTSVRVEVGLQ